jgi:hypothetical protein
MKITAAMAFCRAALSVCSAVLLQQMQMLYLVAVTLTIVCTHKEHHLQQGLYPANL